MSGRSRRLFWAGARTMGRSLGARVRGMRDPEARGRFWAATGADWLQLLGEMKGAAMKLGQLASQYEDLLPKELADALRQLQRDAPPRSLAEMEPVMAAAWTPEQRARIAHIAEPAAAAASIGQVHRAWLDDGRAVALKLRYPEVRAAIDEDVAALGRLFRMARAMPVDGAALDAVLEEVRARFVEETDYRCELASLERLRAGRKHGFIRMPEPVEALCTEATLVTSWEESSSLQQARQWPQAERDRLGDHLARWVVAQIFDDGFLHADPHPGNFGFHQNGDISVYDFGCAVAVRPEARAHMLSGLAGALTDDWGRVHTALAGLGAVQPGTAPSDAEIAMYRDVRDVVAGPLTAAPRFDFSDGHIIEDARRVARKHFRTAFTHRPVSELVFVMRTLSGMYWLQRNLGARVRMRAVLHAAARKAR